MAEITNIEITNFIAKAQLKQIDLASCYVDSDGEDEAALDLLTELSNCLDSLDSIYNTASEDEILRTIHHLSNKAKLNNYPVISFPNFNTTIEVVEHVIIEQTGSSTEPVDIEAYLKALPGFGNNKVLSTDVFGNFLWATVTQNVENIPPVANAGTDAAITLPVNSIILQGSGTDSDGAISAYLWEQTIGPNTSIISDATIAQPTASGLSEGTYVFRLTVTDNLGATHQDTVQVIVNPALPPVAPTGGEADSLSNKVYFTPDPGTTAADYEIEITA